VVKFAGRHTGNGSVYDGAVLELDGHRFVVQLHQEPVKAQPPDQIRTNSGENCTKRISRVNRIEEKEGKKGMLAYLTSFILEPLGGRLGAEVKLGFFAGELLPRADSERGEEA
jgi:hypothetical protein